MIFLILMIIMTAMPVFARNDSEADEELILVTGPASSGTTKNGTGSDTSDGTGVRLSGRGATENDGPTVAEIDTTSENPCITWFVRGIEGKVEEAEVYVGADTADVASAGRLESGSGLAPKTLILLDNSESIGTKPNQEKIKAIMTRMIWNHQSNERFAIKTFAKESEKVMDYTTNYDKLRLAIEKITFHDQQTYLRNVLFDEINELKNDGELDYSRIIIISDGTDDSRLGMSYEELTRLVDDQNGCCPIYTVGCFYEESVGILDQLFALSRLTGSPYFSLDDFETAGEAAEIADEIREDGDDITYFRFSLPLELRDGSLKSVGLHVKTADEEYNVSKAMFLPGGTVEEMRDLYEQRRVAAEEEERRRKEEEEAAKAAATADAAVPEEIAETAATGDTGISEPEEIEEEPKTLLETIFDNRFFDFIFVPILLILLMLYLYRRGRQKEVAFREVNRTQPPLPQGRKGPGPAPGPGKGGLFLTNMDRPERVYHLNDGNTVVFGRSAARSDIAFPDDRTLASRHAVISLQNGRAVLDSLGHLDTTLVQDNQVDHPVELHDGDVIQIGSIRLKVRYE